MTEDSKDELDKKNVRFKKRDGDLTLAELLDGLTDSILYQTDINIALLNALIVIKSGGAEKLSIDEIVEKQSNLLSLNRILIERYLEARNGN